MKSPTASADLPNDPHAAAVVLLERIAQSRCRDAFSELYDRFSGVLYATIFTILKDHSEAEDAVQDCFCSVWKNAGQYNPERGRAVAWMMTIARNKAFDQLAKAQRQGKISTRLQDKEAESAPTADAFTTMAVNEESQAVREALEELPVDQREAIQLAFIKGMSQSEVATSLNQPLGTIKARIRRGLYHLRGTLHSHLVDSGT